MGKTISLIPGDGIGPSIVDATLEVLDAAGAELEFDRQLAGMAAVHDSADPLPPETIESVGRTTWATRWQRSTRAWWSSRR